MVLAGVLDSDASRKARALCVSATPFASPRHLRRRSGLPTRHRAGIWRADQAWRQLLFAYSQATVPQVTVSRARLTAEPTTSWLPALGGDINYAWPTAEIAVMGAKGAVESSSALTSGTRKDRPHTREYEARFLSPFVAAERGYVDDVIMPHATRRRVSGRSPCCARSRSRCRRGSTTICHCDKSHRDLPRVEIQAAIADAAFKNCFILFMEARIKRGQYFVSSVECPREFRHIDVRPLAVTYIVASLDYVRIERNFPIPNLIIEFNLEVLSEKSQKLRTVVSSANRSLSERSANDFPTQRLSTPFNRNLVSPNRPF